MNRSSSASTVDSHLSNLEGKAETDLTPDKIEAPATDMDPELENAKLQERLDTSSKPSEPLEEHTAATDASPSHLDSLTDQSDQSGLPCVDGLTLQSEEPTSISDIDPRLRDGFVDDDSPPVEKTSPARAHGIPIIRDTEQSVPALSMTSSYETITSASTSSEGSMMEDLQSTYFEVFDIQAQYRRCLDVAIRLFVMSHKSEVHGSKANDAIALMNDINVERRPFQYKVFSLNKSIEKLEQSKEIENLAKNIEVKESDKQRDWASIKTSRGVDTIYSRWMADQVIIWEKCLENVGESAK